MNQAVSFQTRARTIDHLGRGQIADAPTAISELWKNAYDAYAQNVALHIFGGEPEVASIFDDGVGMDRADIVQRWLVIGTESKVEDADSSPKETFGLPFRFRQGEKGIGRLSVAFLAPVTVVISRKRGGNFVAVLVDWRLFENPFISLDDIKLPVEEFANAAELETGLRNMSATLQENLGDGVDDRALRLQDSWARYSRHESETGALSTASAIRNSWKSFGIKKRHLEEWPVFVGLSEHGTAMFMIGIHHELNVWVRSDPKTAEVELVKDHLRETLTGFTDPFGDSRADFDYEVWCHLTDGRGDWVLRSLDPLAGGI